MYDLGSRIFEFVPFKKYPLVLFPGVYFIRRPHDFGQCSQLYSGKLTIPLADSNVSVFNSVSEIIQTLYVCLCMQSECEVWCQSCQTEQIFPNQKRLFWTWISCFHNIFSNKKKKKGRKKKGCIIFLVRTRIWGICLACASSNAASVLGSALREDNYWFMRRFCMFCL